MSVIDRIDYSLIDADNHFYEPVDCFTRFLEPEFSDRTIRWIEDSADEAQGGHWFIGDRTYSFTRAGMVNFAGAPGARADFFAGKKEVGLTVDQPTTMVRPMEHPEFLYRAAREQVMDEQGLQAILQLPTLGVMWEHDWHLDIASLFANVRSFNRWVEAEWGFGGGGRIFGAATMSLRDLDLAIAELERLGECGAKIVCLKTGPVDGRSPADTYFDPFWARAEEMGMLIAFHVTNSGYTELFSAAWGELPNPYNSEYSPFQHYTCLITRPTQDTLASLVLGNLFGRFPGLKVLSLEHGSSWVPELLTGMDRAAIHGAHGIWPGGKFSDRPSDIFREHIYVAPFHEDDTVALLDFLPAERVLFGSDWPHSEGIARPIDFANNLEGLSDYQIRRIMRDNAAGLLGIG